MPFTTTPLEFTWENLNDNWATLFNTWLGEFDLTQRIQIGDGTPVDVTSSVFRVSTARGRNRDLQRTNAGAIGVSLRNENRLFDPLTDSPLKPFLKPRVPIVLKIDGVPAFTGTINDWDFTYEVGGVSVASINGADAFTFLAQESAVGSAVAESSGARLERVLNDLPNPYPADKRQIDAGNATFHDAEYSQNALQYIQSIEESEGGLVFISKNGSINLQQRLIQPVEDALVFSDDGSGIPYDNIEIVFGTDLLANDILVESVEGTATATNTQSITDNGVAELNINSLLASGSLSGLADYLLFRFGEPEYRIAAVTVNLKLLNTAQRSSVLQLELGQQADLSFTPNRIGDPINLRNRITGISHDIGLDEHKVTFNFEALGFAFFILDDDPAGKLDNTDFVLGF